MTSRERVSTEIIRKIVDHYAMLESDAQVLRADLARQLTIQYRATVQEQITLYGCQKTVTGPDREAQQWIDAYTEKYGQSIANTYNRELANKVQAIYAANPRSNRYAYIRELEAWTTRRNAYKVDSIALNTFTAARKYAQDRFVEENGIEGRWTFTGPPPVCKICIRIKALGVVTLETTKKRPLPAHPSCPHRWSQVVPKKIDCSNAWTG